MFTQIKSWIFAMLGVLVMASTQAHAQAARNFVGFWWNPAESGWGLSIQQQGINIFALWYTYDSVGKPVWYSLNCNQAGRGCEGDLYTATGTPFAQITGPANFQAIKSGTASLTVTPGGKLTLIYSVGAVTQTKANLERVDIVPADQVPFCRLQSSSRINASNYTDQWWGGASASGWGIQITHQSNRMFIGWYGYDDNRNASWFTGDATQDASNPKRFTGSLYQVANGVPFDRINGVALGTVTTVGAFEFNFTNGEQGTYTYSLPAYSVENRVLPIIRFAVASGDTNLCESPAAPPPPTGVSLYASPQQYTPAAPLDGYNVVTAYGSGANAYTRTIPILVRYPVGTAGKLPLVVWSHGGEKKNDGKYQNTEWADALVRAGYITVHMSHLPRTDGERALLAAEFGFAASAVNNEVESNIDRPRDAIATLNDLNKIEAFFPQLAGKIDYDRIGLGGHSRGAYTVRTAACARVDLPGNPDYSFLDASKPTNIALKIQPKAYLANSPQGPNRFGLFDRGNGNHSWRECFKPDLTQSGDGDFTGEQPADRVKPFDLMPTGDKYKMYIADPNAPHDTFNLNNADQPVFESYVRSTGLAFLDAYLKELPAAKAYLTSKTLEAASSNRATISTRLTSPPTSADSGFAKLTFKNDYAVGSRDPAGKF